MKDKRVKKILIPLIIMIFIIFCLFILAYIMSGSVGIPDAIYAFTEYYGLYLYFIPVCTFVVTRFLLRDSEEGRVKRTIVLAVHIVLLDFFAVCIDLFCPSGYLLIKLFAEFIAALLLCASEKLDRSVLKEKAASFIYTYRYEFILCITGTVQFALGSYGHINPWPGVWYVMNYNDGFGSRLLPGHVLYLLSGNYHSESLLTTYVLVVLYADVILLSVIVGGFLRKSGRDIGAVYLALLYLVMPGGIKFLWTKENLGRPETFMLFFMMIGILIFTRIKNNALRYILLSVCIVLANACYQALIFLYFPVIFAMLAKEIEEKKEKKYIMGAAAVCFVAAASFFVFQFATGIHYADVDEAAAVLESRTDMEIDRDALFQECFGSVRSSWLTNSLPLIKHGEDGVLRILGCMNTMLLLPFILIFTYMWSVMWQNGNKKLYSCVLLADMLIFIQFALTMDWGRWFAAGLTVQFMELLYLYEENDRGAVAATKKFSGLIKSHTLCAAFLLIYMGMLSPLQAAVQSEDSRRLVRHLVRIFGIR